MIMTPYLVVIYDSITCGHVFASVPIDLQKPYPSSVFYECPLCSSTHLFNQKQSFHITTESMSSKFKQYCVNQNIVDLDVEIS